MIKKTLSLMSFTYPCPRKLREIMQMSLIEKETAQNIKHIWNTYHEDRQDNISMDFDSDHFNHFHSKLKQSPLFITPIKRAGGHF